MTATRRLAVILAADVAGYSRLIAVGISAGIGAFTSAVPQLHPYTLELCLAVLALITIVNLRGTLKAGVVFFSAELSVRSQPWRGFCCSAWLRRLQWADIRLRSWRHHRFRPPPRW